MALAKDHPFAMVAEILGVTPSTLYNWAKAWQALVRPSRSIAQTPAVIDLIDLPGVNSGCRWRWYDNASIHRNIDAEKLDLWRVEHRLILLHLPPYSPELNPIEIVWKHTKYHWRRFISWSKAQLLAKVQQLMEGVGSEFIVSFA